MDNISHGPLTGFRVLELGNFIAAPTAGRLLADFGADVIKVERPGTGDELRTWRLHGGTTSLLFRTLGRNKRSITLDMKSERGRNIALALIAKSDVILENFRPGTLERMGLGPEAIHAANPEAVLVRISGYGQTGPYRDRPGFGGVAEAVGGLRHIVGYPDRPPVRVGISLADTVSGLYAVIGALMGLLRRTTKSGGEVVDVALYEAVYSLMESLIPDHDAFGIQRIPAGSGLPGIVPSNTFECADGKYVVISGNGDAIYKRLMHAVGRADLAEDPALGDNSGRVERQEDIETAIAAWTLTLGNDRVLEILEDAGVPSGPIFEAADILADPHFQHRNMLQTHPVDIGEAQQQPVQFPGIVPTLANEPGQTRWLGPELGEHTEEVLAEVGIGPNELSDLRAEGVI
ncbi:MAG: CaiB/BaiF CoA-transferase family protein [Mycobacterium sp.]